IEVAAASFNTVILSQSSGFVDTIDPASTGIPSTTKSGVELAPNEPEPCKRIDCVADGSPLDVSTDNPGTRPWRASKALAVGLPSISLDVTVVFDPRRVPIAVPDP